MMPRGLIIVPAYNEEAAIGPVLEELCQYWPRQDIVVINNGSQDQTSRVVAQCGIREILLPTNLGYGATLRTGILFAEQHAYAYVVAFDADGQHDPKCLAELVRTLIDEKLHLVIGSRSSQGHRDTPITRRVGMKFFIHLTRLLTRQKFTDTTSGFKVIDSAIYCELKRVHFVDFHAEFLIYLLLKRYKVGQVPVVMRQRTSGTSLYNWSSSFSYPAKTILGTVIGIADILVDKIRAAHERHSECL